MVGAECSKGGCRDTGERVAVSGGRARKEDGSATGWRSEHRSRWLDEKELGGGCETAKRRMGETAKAQRLRGRKTRRAGFFVLPSKEIFTRPSRHRRIALSPFRRFASGS